MKIDIDRLTEAELIDLNHRIVARLRLISQMQAHSEMLEFRIGDRVTFRAPGQQQVEGIVTRYNKKTVTVIADNGRQWNVSPNFLSKVIAQEAPSHDGNQPRPVRQTLNAAAANSGQRAGTGPGSLHLHRCPPGSQRQDDLCR